MVEWLRDAYLELTQETPLNLEELRPAKPYPNALDRDWEADAKKWAAISRDWETLARISHLQTKVAISISSFSISYSGDYCYECRVRYGAAVGSLCKCRLLAMVDEAFWEELESFKENPEHVEPPLPGKLPIIIFVSVENNFV